MRVLRSVWRGTAGAALVACVVGVLACGRSSRNTATSPAMGATGGSAGAAEIPGIAGENAGASEGGTPGVESPFGQLRRLSASEYTATTTDVLGALPSVELRQNDVIAGDFDNIAAAVGMNAEFYGRYLEAAEQVAARVFADQGLKNHFVPCAPIDDACVAKALADMGLRLFRRPLFDEERDIYSQLYADTLARGESAEAALQLVLVALLGSAQFLYRMEFPPVDDASPALGVYELATRLSYLIWSSAPDDALFLAAQNNALSQPSGLDAELTRLLADPKSTRFVSNFAGQWLGARELAAHSVALDAYPEWTQAVVDGAAREVYETFNDILRNPRPWSTLLLGRTHAIDGALGPFYDLPQNGDERLTLATGERLGYLGSVAFLSQSSLERRTSPTVRGRLIRERLLCQALPPPPPETPTLATIRTSAAARADLEQASTEPACATCHSLLDPLGTVLERFDAIGKSRTYYEDNTLITSVATLPTSSGEPEGPVAETVTDLAEWLVADPAFKECLARKLFTYASGKLPNAADEVHVQAVIAQWQQGPDELGPLLRALVGADWFRSHAHAEEP